MVFSSFPVYLDHPNLHQFSQQPPDHLQQHQQVIAAVDQNGQIQPPPPPMAVGGGGGGGIRPGSMVDRARLAKMPLPEAGLKCPRCDSANTKFCYFNNYSLSQPRHFCKTCRRYWTRGGALRSVPVGGGCRRNKKAKTNGSKSGDQRQTPAAGSNTANPSTSPSRGISPDVSGAHFTHEPSSSHQLPFNMAAFQSLGHYGGGGHIGQSTIGGFQVPNMGFNLSGSGSGNDMSEWRLPNVGGMFEPQPSLFPLINQGEGVDHHHQQQQQQLGSLAMTSSGVASDPQDGSSVKREDTINLTKQFMVNSSSHDQGNNGQFWGGNIPWTGFSGLNSSNSSHLL